MTRLPNIYFSVLQRSSGHTGEMLNGPRNKKPNTLRTVGWLLWFVGCRESNRYWDNRVISFIYYEGITRHCTSLQSKPDSKRNPIDWRGSIVISRVYFSHFQSKYFGNQHKFKPNRYRLTCRQFISFLRKSVESLVKPSRINYHRDSVFRKRVHSQNHYADYTLIK